MVIQTADREVAEELELYIINDSGMYRQMAQPLILNYARKKVNRTYDGNLAIKGFINLVETGVKKYRRDFGSDSLGGPINRATKELTGKHLLRYYQEEIMDTARMMKILKDAGKPWTMRG